MAQPNKFQFFLDLNTGTEEVISQAPENWLNTAIKQTRSKVYGGLFRGEMTPTAFVTKAAFLLRQHFYKNGIVARAKSIIKLQNTDTWQFNQIFKGVLDFSKHTDTITSFTIPAISDDFTVQLGANDSTNYAIPLDVPEAINLELTPLALKEQADYIFNTSPDFRANSFFQISVSYNQQNSVNASTHEQGFLAQVPPIFDDTQPNWFYIARMDTTVKISGSIQSSVNTAHFQYNIYKTGGTLVKTIGEINNTGPTIQYNCQWDFSVKLNKGEKLFFYIVKVGSASTNAPGVNMQAGSMHLEYSTISPATMCKALPALYVFKYLLQAMNTNENSGPNQPVPYKSDLLSGPMANLVITSGDSIRTAVGSLYYAGDTLFPGTYKVATGTINYAGNAYNTGETFPFNPSSNTFSGSGVAEKVVSGFVGTVYEEGDTLQAGGKYLVGGDSGTYIVYAGVNRPVGTYFDYVLGFDTFISSDPTNFVQQTGVRPQLLINFRDFFQSIYSVQGGNCSFGIETVNGVSTCFIENLDYVYRKSIGNLNIGTVDRNIKIEPASDRVGNTIKAGYKDQQYSQLNGFSEVNSTQNYGTALFNPKNEINLVSVFRADPYGIEEARVSQNDTASSRSDNDTFMVFKKTDPENVVPIGDIGFFYHPLRTETLASITGIDETYYNWFLSPKQNLLRGGNYLASIFYNMKGYQITLTGATKSTAMVTIDNLGRRVAEADPIYISTLPKPLFIPIYVTCKPGMPTNAIQMIDSVPYGFVTFKYNQKTFKMFIESVAVDIGQNTEQEIKGILTPDNDLNQFIH